MAAIVTNRSTFSDFLSESALPWAKAADSIIWNEYNGRTSQFTKLFKMMKSTKPFEQTKSLGGFQSFRMIPEGGRVKYIGVQQGFRKTYSFIKYGAAYFLTPELMDDDQTDMVGQMATDFGRAAAETKEILGSEVWNRAFDSTYLGPDGVPLISTAHPLITGGTQSNAASSVAVTGLTYAGLQAVRTLMRRMRDHSGRRVRIPGPYQLVVCPELEFLAHQITKSVDDPTTANRATNTHKYAEGGMPEVFVYDYLNGTTPWFLKAAPQYTQIRFYTRQDFRMMHDRDFETLGGVKHAGGFRIGSGWSDFYGVVGSPGV